MGNSAATRLGPMAEPARDERFADSVSRVVPFGSTVSCDLLGSAVDQAIAAAAIRAVDAERHRIGRELHDGVAQVITATIFLLDQCLAENPQLTGEARSAIGRARQLLDEATTDLYRVVSDLRPRIVEDLGLVDAIRWYARRWGQETGILVDIALDETIRLPKDVEASAFRIVQEALANVRKHAVASHVVIGLCRSGEEVLLTIRDNGQGFRPSMTPRTEDALTGNGLSGMLERARLLGGELRVFSAPAFGTEITLCIPAGSLEGTEQCIAPNCTTMEDAPCLVSG